MSHKTTPRLRTASCLPASPMPDDPRGMHRADSRPDTLIGWTHWTRWTCAAPCVYRSRSRRRDTGRTSQFHARDATVPGSADSLGPVVEPSACSPVHVLDRPRRERCDADDTIHVIRPLNVSVCASCAKPSCSTLSERNRRSMIGFVSRTAFEKDASPAVATDAQMPSSAVTPIRARALLRRWLTRCVGISDRWRDRAGRGDTAPNPRVNREDLGRCTPTARPLRTTNAVERRCGAATTRQKRKGHHSRKS